MAGPITIRTNHAQLRSVLDWLRANNLPQSEYLRDWLERGFKLWLIETAVLDPALYADLLAATAALPSDGEVLRQQGLAALHETLSALVSGVGLTAGAVGHHEADPVADAVADAGGAEMELRIFADIGDDFTSY